MISSLTVRILILSTRTQLAKPLFSAKSAKLIHTTRDLLHNRCFLGGWSLNFINELVSQETVSHVFPLLSPAQFLPSKDVIHVPLSPPQETSKLPKTNSKFAPEK